MTDEEIVAAIQSYWRQRGHKVDVSFCDVPMLASNDSVRHYRAVRSNLLNGLPQGWRGESLEIVT